MIRILMLSGGCMCVLLFGADSRPDPLLLLTWPLGLASAIERPYAGICVVVTTDRAHVCMRRSRTLGCAKRG